jgi:hypothetical protein
MRGSRIWSTLRRRLVRSVMVSRDGHVEGEAGRLRVVRAERPAEAEVEVGEGEHGHATDLQAPAHRDVGLEVRFALAYSSTSRLSSGCVGVLGIEPLDVEAVGEVEPEGQAQPVAGGDLQRAVGVELEAG